VTDGPAINLVTPANSTAQLRASASPACILEVGDRMAREWNLNVQNLAAGQSVPEQEAAFGILNRTDPGRCCHLRKVEPLHRALQGRAAWMTGLKRSDAPTRAAAPIVSWDEARGLVKVNPVATWSDDDIANYQADHGLPVHPLMTQGYLSIGCAPTTRPVAPGEDARAGRWSGMGKTECGLHV